MENHNKTLIYNVRLCCLIHIILLESNTYCTGYALLGLPVLYCTVLYWLVYSERAAIQEWFSSRNLYEELLHHDY